MASDRTAGARAFARLAACFLTVFSSASAIADDEVPPPFIEYEGGDRFSTLVSEAAQWQMADTCEWEGYLYCELDLARAKSDGWVSRWHYVIDRAGGQTERQDMTGGGDAYYGCPEGYELYVVAFGFPAGPYPNRTIDVGGPYPALCKALPASLGGPAPL